MSTLPRASVITIFLDAEKFIEQSIRSVLAQSYGERVGVGEPVLPNKAGSLC